MQNFKTEFFFKDSADMILHITVEVIEAEDYEEAVSVAKEVMESMCAQDFKVTDNN